VKKAVLARFAAREIGRKTTSEVTKKFKERSLNMGFYPLGVFSAIQFY
jgi:hypothetical protein